MYLRDIEEYENAKEPYTLMWMKGMPTKVGVYWLYCYRYGKISCGDECKKELHLLEVQEVSNGLLMKADGQFLFANEVEEPMYKHVMLPELPKEG